MKAVISKNQFNRIKNFINETKEIKKDEVIGKKKKSFPDLTGDGEVTKADILKGRGVELDEKKKLSKKQLRTFDIDNDNKPFEPRDLAALRASKKLSKELDEGSDCGCGEDKDDTRYMFFSNLEQMMRQAKMLLQMDEDMIEDLLNNGHDWAADHIAEAKNNMDQVFDFIMNEMNGEGEDDDWDSEEKGMINEDYLELRSIAKKLYSFLKSKGIRVKLERGQGFRDLLQRHGPTGERHIWDNTAIWDRGNSASLRSDGRFINQSKINKNKFTKEISDDKFESNFNPEVIIQEPSHAVRKGDDFSFEILISAPKKEERDMFGTRKVVDEEKSKNYQKIILDFLKQFTDVNITEVRSYENLKVYNVSAIEPSINEAMSLKKKAFVSKELKNHLDNKISLSESEFRSGSPKHIELLKEVKELYNKGIISLNETDEFIVTEFDPNPIKVKGVGEVYLGLILEEYESEEQLLSEAVYQGRKVQLGKPFLTPDGPKKRSVYVRNDKGNVVKVNFGDPNMKIKKNIPARRKSFRARHKCSNPGPRFKSRYWSCRFW